MRKPSKRSSMHSLGRKVCGCRVVVVFQRVGQDSTTRVWVRVRVRVRVRVSGSRGRVRARVNEDRHAHARTPAHTPAHDHIYNHEHQHLHSTPIRPLVIHPPTAVRFSARLTASAAEAMLRGL